MKQEETYKTGKTFCIRDREGGRTVGSGRVASIIE